MANHDLQAPKPDDGNAKPSPSPSLLNDCDTCLHADVNQCAESLVFNLGLTDGTEYEFTFTDGHNKKHIVKATAISDGSATIDVADLPKGFFIVYAGVKTVTIREAGSCEDLCFTTCGQKDDVGIEYCCIILTPVDISGDVSDPISVEIPCCSGKETLVLLSVVFVCHEPPDGKATATLEGSVINGSGNYELQRYNGTDWETGEVFTGTQNGDINLAIDSLDTPPSPTTILLRLYDTDTGAFSSPLEVLIPHCGGGDTESLEILSITGEDCVDGNLNATVNCDIQNPVGSIEIWVNGLFNGTVGGGSTLINFTAVEGQSDIPLFLRDSISGVESPIFYYSFINCDAPADSIVILQAVSSCEGSQQSASVQIEINYDSTGKTFLLEVYEGGWNPVLSVIGNGQTQFYISGNTNVLSGDHLIRVYDSSSGIYSPEQTLTFANCEPSSIVLQTLDLSGNNLTHGYTCFNIFEYTGGLLDLLREYSEDNLIFIPISNVAGWITTNPDDIYHSNTASTTSYVSGNFARVTGRDINGNLVHSNSLQIVDEPILAKCDPYCFAGQAGVIIHGFVDSIFNQSYALEYRLAGSGDPYTFVTDLNATAGEFGDSSYPIGVGNEVSGQALEFRIRSSVYSWIFSADFAVLMLPPC